MASEDDALRAQAAADGADAVTEAASREQRAWDLHVEEREAANTLTFAHAGVQFAKADFIKAMGGLLILVVLAAVVLLSAVVFR